MTKNSRPFAPIALLTLLSLSGCASQTVCRRPQLHDAPAPPPLAFSQCLREIIAVGQGKQAQISSLCSKLLQPAQTK